MTELLFGLNVSTSAEPGTDPVADAVRAEELGFDFVSASDHLHGRAPTYEPWTMLSWMAASTSRIRLATRVLGVPYRNPAVVAKMAETFHRLSRGRLILGLGGGYSDEEFRAFGLGERSPRDKIDGLEEAIHVIRGLWSERDFTFGGRLYRTDHAEIEPKPDRPTPIWLGTYGNRALEVTGRLADGWIPSLGFASPEEVRVMRDRVIASARAAGRDPRQITCIYNVGIRVDERAETQTDVVSGPPDAVVRRLLGLLQIGFAGFNFIPAGGDEGEQAERLAGEVIPALRQESRSAG